MVVLDRDGVINKESASFIKTPEEWIPIPGSLDAIARLTLAGIPFFVATNQSGVGRGLFTLETLEAIHEKMRLAVEEAGGDLAGIFFCPHAPGARCDCRKPRPGLLRQIEQRFSCSLSGSPIIGDSARDLEAAAAVDGRPILVRTGNGRKTEKTLDQSFGQLAVYDDLAAAVADLLVADSTF
ncbi:MAG: D-glycero-beta-D-manno-heptose 1,7-bisphosphate 7-phosphatase [Boseongicola sp.]